MGWLSNLLKDYPALSVAKERLALEEAKQSALVKENNELKEEIERQNSVIDKLSPSEALTELGEQFLLSMAREGDKQYQIPYFIRVLEIDKAKAQFYASHLTDLGLIKCKTKGDFRHYSMEKKGRSYLVSKRLI